MSDCVVTFDYATWAAQFPALGKTTNEATATSYFGFAGLFLNNTAMSQIVDVTVRAPILNLITAHIAVLFGNGANGPSPLVGRINQATEGSVSVSAELAGMGKNEAWWTQTPYGIMAWQAMAPWRTARYIAAPQIPLAQQSYPVGLLGTGYPGLWPWPR